MNATTPDLWSESSIRAMDKDNYLFPMSVQLSPKRRWLEQHGLHTRRRDDGKWECVLFWTTAIWREVTRRRSALPISASGIR